MTCIGCERNAHLLIADKIGKADAEKDYYERVLLIIQVGQAVV